MEKAPQHRSLFEKALLAAASATLPMESSPAYAQVASEWRSGFQELERLSEEDRRENLAFFVATGREGAFISMDGVVVERKDTSVRWSDERLAQAVDKAYREAQERGESVPHVRILEMHTHTLEMLQDYAKAFGSELFELSGRTNILTMPPSLTDVNPETWRNDLKLFLENLQVVPREIIHYESASVDSVLTYYFSPISETDSPMERADDVMFASVSQFYDVGETVFIFFMEDDAAAAAIAAEPDAENFPLHPSLVDSDEEKRRVYTMLTTHGREDLARALQDAERNVLAAYAAHPRVDLDSFRMAWALYVTNARLQGSSWEEILSSSEHTALRAEYAYYGMNLRVVPNEVAAEQEPFSRPVAP